MIQGREYFCFALKPCKPIGIGRERRRQDLDRDRALQSRVRRSKHLPHSAFANLARHVVDAEAGAGSERQVARSIAVTPVPTG